MAAVKSPSVSSPPSAIAKGAPLSESSGDRPLTLEMVLCELAADALVDAELIKASLGSTFKLIDVKDVLFLYSDEKYARVVTAGEEALIRKPLREMLDELDPNVFWQIHRGTIVNVNAIGGVTRDFRGDATVKVKNHKEQLKVSRPFSHLFKQM